MALHHFTIHMEYAAQMTAACALYVLPVRRKASGYWYFLLFCALGMAIGIPASFLSIPQDSTILDILYWIVLSLVYVLPIRLCTEGGWRQAVYIAFCAVSTQHAAFDLWQIFRFLEDDRYWLYMLLMPAVFIPVYWFVYRTIARRMVVGHHYPFGLGNLVSVFMIVLMAQVISVLMQRPLWGMEWSERMLYYIVEAACCLYILKGQADQAQKERLQQEVDGVRAQMEQQRRQYRITQDTIDVINRKCHDLRHQVRALAAASGAQKSAYVAEINQALNIYDTAINTGSRALDTVIMDRNLYCQAHNIQFTCLADGKLLSFMQDEDIYALFGNTLDNAIEAASAIADPARRVVSVRVYRQNAFVMIQVRNYYTGTILFENGLPRTHHHDHTIHGYGVKSIQYTAADYNGVMTIDAQDGVFTLQVMLPITENVSGGQVP